MKKSATKSPGRLLAVIIWRSMSAGFSQGCLSRIKLHGLVRPDIRIWNGSRYGKIAPQRFVLLQQAGILPVQFTVNRPCFPGECFICELRLPDHHFRWKRNMPFLLLPAGYDPVVPATVGYCTSPPTSVWPVSLRRGFSSSYRFIKSVDALRHRVVIRVACTSC